MPAFVPAALKHWKPEHSKGPIRRRCHWCSGCKMRVGSMVQVLESPMRYHFCGEKCLQLWRQHRHSAEVVAWLRQCTGDRHKILSELRNAQD